MKNKLVFIFAFLSSQAFSQSTDTLTKKYDQQFINRYGSSFMKGGTKLSFGDLRNEFNTTSHAFDLYIRSKKNKTVSTVLRFLSIFAVVGVLRSARENNTGLAYGLVAGQIVTALVGQHYHFKSTIDLDRALQIRNRELLFPPK